MPQFVGSWWFTISAILAWCRIVAVADSRINCTVVAPQEGEDFRCALKGHLRSPADPAYPISDLAIVSTLKECAYLCRRRVYDEANYQYNINYDGYDYLFPTNSWCKSFFYDTKTHVCQLGQKNIRGAAKPAANSTTMFYDHQCFDCGDICDQPYGAQLIDNTGFEEKPFGPWRSIRTSIAKGYNSSRSMRCERFCQLFQSANMCHGQLYSLEFDYKFKTLDVPKAERSFRGILGNPSTFSLSNASAAFESVVRGKTPSPGWAHARTFLRPEGDHDGPAFQNIAGVDFLIDNVVLYHVPEPSVSAGENSIIANGGFETGSLMPWSFFKGKYKSVTGKLVSPGLRGSSYAFEWTELGGGSLYSSRLKQTLTTAPNKSYQFTADVRVLQDGLWYLAFSFDSGFNRVTQAFQRRQGLHTFSIPFTARENSTEFLFNAVNRQGRGSILLDNFSLKKIDATEFY